MGEEKAIAHALETFRSEIGDKTVTPSATKFVMWRDDPFAFGGYSVCLPGGFPGRAALGKPTPPLYWAGEATSPTSTAHGAFDSGVRVAKEILGN
jgi:monoamine oxidase